MNTRFSDYVTSGAFQISLSRHQISALAMLGGGDSPNFGVAALERRGLCEAIPTAHGEGQTYRLTAAGAVCLSLLAEAGLVNGPREPLAVEVDALRRDLTEARREVAEARLRACSALARKQDAERALAECRADLERSRCGVDLKPESTWPKVCVRLKDPLPHVPDADLVGGEP